MMRLRDARIVRQAIADGMKTPPDFVERAADWWRAGCNTHEISYAMRVPEHVVYNHIEAIKREAATRVTE